MIDGLVFDNDSHTYKINGLIIPSVTQIIQGAGLTNFDNVPDFILKEKADLGTKVHSATELYDKGTLDRKSLHPVLKRYLNSWIEFKKDYGFIVEGIEDTYYHPLYNFIGRVDRTGLINNKKVLVDIKSGMKYKTHAIQTAGYQILYDYDKHKTERIKERLTVYLSETGYKVEPNKNPNDTNVFLAALTIFNFLKK
jgi:hypothetical protein